MDATNESQVLKRLDFPAYCIRMLENGLVALSGGGGTAKTGVANAIELGLVDYDLNDYSNQRSATSKDANSSPHTPILERLLANGFRRGPLKAQFETVHAYQPADAIMKFISFSIDRPCKGCKQKAGDQSASKRQPNENATSPSPANVRRNVFLIAAVNNWLEFYEVKPVVQKTVDQFEANHGAQDAASLRQRKSSSGGKSKKSSTKIDNNNNKGQVDNGSVVHSAKTSRGDQPLKAGSQLNLIFKLDTVANKTIDLINKIDNEAFLPETAPSEATETVNAMAVSKATAATTSGGKSDKNSSIQLCVGTSKGSIMIWNLVLQFDDNGHVHTVNAERTHVNASAHSGKEIDDLQVNESLVDPNAGISHLMSIGRDNKCCLWSLLAKEAGRKLAEIDYIASLGGNANLRMRHARYDALGRNFYATYIPRSRGGGSSGSDTSSFLQRWEPLKFKKPPGYQVNTNGSAKDLVEFELNGTVFNYKLMATRRIRNTIVTAMQCSRDGSQVCVGDYEGRVYLFDADLNALRHFKRQHTSVVTDLAFYYDSVRPHEASKLILSLSIDRTLQCYKNLTCVAGGSSSSDKALANKFTLLKTESFLDAKKSASKALMSSSKQSSFSLLGVMIPKLFCLLGIFFLVFCYFFARFE